MHIKFKELDVCVDDPFSQIQSHSYIVTVHLCLHLHGDFIFKKILVLVDSSSWYCPGASVPQPNYKNIYAYITINCSKLWL